jgi:hypothetical protein
VVISIVCVQLAIFVISAFLAIVGRTDDAADIAKAMADGTSKGLSLTLIFFVELMVFAYRDRDVDDA